MSKFKILNEDQGHINTHYIEAVNQREALSRFRAGHYGTVIHCEAVRQPTTNADPVAAYKEELRKKVEKRKEDRMIIVKNESRPDALRDIAFGNVVACEWFLSLLEQK